MLVVGLSVVVPGVWLCVVVIVLAGLKLGQPALRARLAPLWKTALLLYPWSMLGVYLLGAYVAYTRLSDAVDTNVAAGGSPPRGLRPRQTRLLNPVRLEPGQGSSRDST